MQERRRFVRVDTPVLVEFPNPSSMKTERSYTRNVSQTGLQFPTTVRLQVGQEIPLTLQLPFGNSAMQATGEIQWVREIARMGEPQYEVGVRFRWMEDPDKARLVQHLTSLYPRRS